MSPDRYYEVLLSNFNARKTGLLNSSVGTGNFFSWPIDGIDGNPDAIAGSVPDLVIAEVSPNPTPLPKIDSLLGR